MTNTEVQPGAEEQPLDMNEIIAQRHRKRQELIDAGMNPYGERVDNLTATAVVKSNYETAGEPEGSETMHIAGRLTAMRKMGKVVFADVRDESGRLQIFCQKNQLGDEMFTGLKLFDIGDLVTVSGQMFTTRTGEPTLRVDCIRMLAKSLLPLPEKWHGLTDVEQRYRQRYLDLIGNEGVREQFKTRCRIIRCIRDFLDDRGFMEMETPMLQPVAGGAAARPFETYYHALDCPMFLRIAPELYLKRLLVGGFERIYEINRNFRNEGLSRRHNPEFTMIEIYQAYGDCQSMMELVEELITSVALKVFGTLTLKNSAGVEINLERPWRRATYQELVLAEMGADWFDVDDQERLARAQAAGLKVTPAMDCGEVTHEVYEKAIEAKLIQPTFVTRLPAALVPLAKLCADDPSCVDVFELEINGQEIAPGYSELNDPVDQRRRFEEQARLAAKTDNPELSGKLDEDFLTALEHGMPPAGGMGIGIDRLVMLLTGAASIRDVILFPQLRPQG